MSEWLRRWTRNPLGSARRGSNPLGVVTSCAEGLVSLLSFPALRLAPPPPSLVLRPLPAFLPLCEVLASARWWRLGGTVLRERGGAVARVLLASALVTQADMVAYAGRFLLQDACFARQFEHARCAATGAAWHVGAQATRSRGQGAWRQRKALTPRVEQPQAPLAFRDKSSAQQ